STGGDHERAAIPIFNRRNDPGLRTTHALAAVARGDLARAPDVPAYPAGRFLLPDLHLPAADGQCHRLPGVESFPRLVGGADQGVPLWPMGRAGPVPADVYRPAFYEFTD